MAPKKNIDLEFADKFYEGIQEYVDRIEKTRAAIEKNKASIPEHLQDYDADVLKALENSGIKIDENDEAISELKKYSNAIGAVEKLEAQEKKLAEDKEKLEENIKIAISKYIAQTEKEMVKLQKSRDNYEKFIQEEQAELATLEAKIKDLEGIEEQEEVLKDLKVKYENLKNGIEEKLKKLESFDKELADLKTELERNKEKYKDYLELSDKDITEPVDKREPEEQEESKEKEAEETPKKEEATEETVEKKEDTKSTKKEDNVYYTVPSGETTTEEPEKVEPETDEQAFKRIYKLLSKKKTRDSVTNEDIDKMIEILSDKDNYDKLNINIRRFLNSPLFPSKAEKIYKCIGKRLAQDINKLDKDALDADGIVEITKYENLIKLGFANGEDLTKAEQAINSILDKANESDKDKALDLKERILRYRKSTTTLDEVIASRGEFGDNNIMLKAGSEKAENTKKEASLSDSLGGQVKDENELGEPTSSGKDSKEVQIEEEKAI